jgi:hypothetical protein
VTPSIDAATVETRRVDESARGGLRHREEVRREPQVGNAVAARDADELPELRVDHGLRGARERDAPGAGEEVGRDALEDVDRHVPVVRELPVERRETTAGRRSRSNT